MKMKKLIFAIFLCFGLLIFIQVHLYADEKITLSTYYPAPYGEYRTLAVGDTYPAPDPATVADLVVQGDVGVGTANPYGISGGRMLHVNASGIGAAVLHLTDDTNGQTLTDGMDLFFNQNSGNLWVREDYPLVFATNNNERMRIINSGNVGIGTTVPGARLHVIEDSTSNNATIGVRIKHSPTYVGPGPVPAAAWGLYIETTNNSTAAYGCIASASGGNAEKCGVRGNATSAGGTNYGVRGTASNGTTNWAGYFDGNGYFSGNVGIGTTAPAEKLAVNGKIKLGTNAAFFAASSDTSTRIIYENVESDGTMPWPTGQISVTKNGVGDYTINYVTSFLSVAAPAITVFGEGVAYTTSKSTTSCRVKIVALDGTPKDAQFSIIVAGRQ